MIVIHFLAENTIFYDLGAILLRFWGKENTVIGSLGVYIVLISSPLLTVVKGVPLSCRKELSPGLYCNMAEAEETNGVGGSGAVPEIELIIKVSIITVIIHIVLSLVMNDSSSNLFVTHIFFCRIRIIECGTINL